MVNRGQSVSGDTLESVERTCRAAGLPRWEVLAAACRNGRLVRVAFASPRPVEFVKEFAELVRASGMEFAVDRELELYVGGGDAIRLCRELNREDLQGLVLGEIMELGAVDEKERKALCVELSAVQRSAGVKYRNQRRPMRLTGVSALVLDDDAVSRKVLAAALQREGCAVKSVGNIDEAFRWLSQSPPDVVIVDISLGGTVDGFAVCEMIHASPPLQATPVIMVTGYPQVNPQERAEKTGARAYFEKPVKPLKLRESVLKSVGRDPR